MDYGTMVLRFCGTVVLRGFGTKVLRYYGAVALRNSFLRYGGRNYNMSMAIYAT
jgi:hypothetical protein